VKCPKCGNEMLRIGGLLSFGIGERTYRSSRYYKCPKCGERKVVIEIKTRDGDLVIDTRSE